MSVQLGSGVKMSILGACSFWLPDVLWHARRQSISNVQDSVTLTVLMPLAFLTAYLVLRGRPLKGSSRATPWPLLAGVWLLAGPFMAVGASFAGAGFVGPDGLSTGTRMVLVSLLPIVSMPLAAHDGSLGALLTVSLAVLLISLWDSGF
jgi:hypothetical protein